MTRDTRKGLNVLITSLIGIAVGMGVSVFLSGPDGKKFRNQVKSKRQAWRQTSRELAEKSHARGEEVVADVKKVANSWMLKSGADVSQLPPDVKARRERYGFDRSADQYNTYQH